jgi:hypothetical protein
MRRGPLLGLHFLDKPVIDSVQRKNRKERIMKEARYEILYNVSPSPLG